MSDILKQIHSSKAYAKGAHDTRLDLFADEQETIAYIKRRRGQKAAERYVGVVGDDLISISECNDRFIQHCNEIMSKDHAEQFHMQDEYAVIANCCTTDNFTPNDLNDCAGIAH